MAVICQRCGSKLLTSDHYKAAYCPECDPQTPPAALAEYRTTRRQAGAPYSALPVQSAPRPNLGPLEPPAISGETEIYALVRKLQERVAKLESAVLDLRRRLETADERRLRKIRETLAEQGLLPNSAADAARAHRFLGPDGNEEPSPEEPGERKE